MSHVERLTQDEKSRRIDYALNVVMGEHSGYDLVDDVKDIRSEIRGMISEYLHKITETPNIDRKQAETDFKKLVSEQTTWTERAKTMVVNTASTAVTGLDSLMSRAVIYDHPPPLDR